MAFTESLARDVRHRCHYQCCLCKGVGVEIHHVVPQSEGGSDAIENAAPLCPSCHETYGANPTKRKFIREARDFWNDLCAKRFAADSGALARLQVALEKLASKDDIEALKSTVDQLASSFRAVPHTISLPLSKSAPGSKARLTIRDLLVFVHAKSSDRPPSQIEMLCLRVLWPLGKDGWRDIYKQFLQRFGERTMRHLAARALDEHKVPYADNLREDHFLASLNSMRLEAMCMVLVDSRLIGAVLSTSGEIFWTGPGAP